MTGEAVSVLVVGSDWRELSIYASALSREFPIHSTAEQTQPKAEEIDADIIVVVGEVSNPEWIETERDFPPTTIAIVDEDTSEIAKSERAAKCLPASAPPSKLVPAVTETARQLLYHRKATECAGLAETYATYESVDSDHEHEKRALGERLSEVKHELDDMITEFSNSDFHQAFRGLTADQV